MKTAEPPSGRAAQRKVAGGPAFRKTELARFLVRARRAAQLPGRVDLLLADDAALAQLNLQYRKKNRATDVLSFPAMAVPGVPGSPGGSLRGSRRAAGDLAISVETAARQAEAHGHSLEDELKILLLHGVLHLAGHDHESDEGEMLRIERKLRRELGLPAGLIERGASAARKKSA